MQQQLLLLTFLGPEFTANMLRTHFQRGLLYSMQE
jgi:hypothetical protein